MFYHSVITSCSGERLDCWRSSAPTSIPTSLHDLFTPAFTHCILDISGMASCIPQPPCWGQSWILSIQNPSSLLSLLGKCISLTTPIHWCAPYNKIIIIEVSLTEPHTSMLNGGLFIFICKYIYLPYVRRSVNASWTLLTRNITCANPIERLRKRRERDCARRAAKTASESDGMCYNKRTWYLIPNMQYFRAAMTWLNFMSYVV